MVSKRSKTSSFNQVGTSWWFVFKDAENRFLSRLLKPGYQHVFMLTRLQNVVLAIEPLMGTVNHVLTDADLAEMLAEYKMNGYTVVHFRYAAQPKSLKIRTPMITCASYLAYTVGMNFFGVTPYQLYKKLMKMGGEIV